MKTGKRVQIDSFLAIGVVTFANESLHFAMSMKLHDVMCICNSIFWTWSSFSFHIFMWLKIINFNYHVIIITVFYTFLFLYHCFYLWISVLDGRVQDYECTRHLEVGILIRCPYWNDSDKCSLLCYDEVNGVYKSNKWRGCCTLTIQLIVYIFDASEHTNIYLGIEA